MRCISRRCLEQAGQHGGFGEIHVSGGFVEIEMRRAVDAERATAHVGAVEIEFENFVLGQAGLQPDRQKRFLHLALNGALIVEE